MQYKELMEKIISAIQEHGIVIDSQMGHLVWIKEREKGKAFSFEEHLRGLIYAQLSNQRPWHQVQKQLPSIDKIFYDYNVAEILQQDYRYFIQKIREIKCGNISIEKQMQSLSDNIFRLREIEKQHDGLDNFVQMYSPDKVANLLSSHKKYKIKYIGFTLALEYLRNVGINTLKPDLHIKRIISNQRLSLIDKDAPNEIEAVKVIETISQESGFSVAEVDAYLWLYCAVGYCNICGADPKCFRCNIVEYCKAHNIFVDSKINESVR